MTAGSYTITADTTTFQQGDVADSCGSREPFAAFKGPHAMARLRYRGLARNDGHAQRFAWVHDHRTASRLIR